MVLSRVFLHQEEMHHRCQRRKAGIRADFEAVTTICGFARNGVDSSAFDTAGSPAARAASLGTGVAL
jgi:hypothetical protein